MNKILHKIYTNTVDPGSYASVKKLYEAGKKKYPSLTKKDVEGFLQSKDSYTLHVNKARNFSRRFYTVGGPGRIICADSAYMTDLRSFNDNVGYLVFFIDLFSRFLYVIPTRSIKADDMLKIFHDIMSQSIYNYSFLFCDRGSEFKNKKMYKFYSENKIKIYSVYNQTIKSGVVERVIRTIKGRIYKFLTHSRTSRYIDELENIVMAYNLSEHSGIMGNIPLNMHFKTDPGELQRYLDKYYKYKVSRLKTIKRRLAVGDYVRLVSAESIHQSFIKGFKQRATREIFMIKNVNNEHIPVTYEVKGLDGENIHGNFYYNELIQVEKPVFFNIIVLKKKKVKKKTLLQVQYLDYGNDDPVWIDSKLLDEQ